MRISYLGFVLLIWFPGALHGQSAPQSCSAPSLDGGFFAPKEETYPHGAQLAYTCGTGRKATVKGWWATSTCQNGKWSHELQCIDEKACIPPTIPNAKYTENSNGWYEEGHIIRITCDKGYHDKNQDATAECINGTWSSVPVCEKSLQACGAPPKIPHAVIINQEYQDVFAADSEVKYECEDGFTVEGADTAKTIICIAGSWTTGPSCRSSTTSDRDSRPLFTTIDNCGDHPSVPHGDVVVKEQIYLKYQCQKYYKREGPETVVCHNDGTWSELPVCKGSSTTSDRDSRPLIITIDNCGDHPSVPHGDVVVTERMYLKYQCQNYYKYEGPETVVCHNDGTWSKLPVCKESFCLIDPAQLVGRGFKLSGVQYMTEGEEKYISCGWDRYSLFRCTNRQISVTESYMAPPPTDQFSRAATREVKTHRLPGQQHSL